MPTSMTTAPSFTMSAPSHRGRPVLTITMSPSRVTAPTSRVRVWHTVTVASAPDAFCISSMAMGLPTISLRPADDDVLAGGIVAAAHQYLLDTERRGRHEAGAARREPPHVDRVQAVHVLFGVDALDHLGFVDMRGERKLDQHAVEAGVALRLRTVVSRAC